MEVEGTVRFRPSWRRVALRQAWSIALLVWFAVLGVGGWTLFVGYGALIVAVSLLIRREGITLTPEASVVHNLRSRVIPWPSIKAITVESWGRIRSVVLWEEGRRTKLGAPAQECVKDPSFHEKYDTIVQWWLAHGGVAAP